MSAEAFPLVEVPCADCRDAYAVLQEPRAPFRCRRCRQVRFAEAMDRLLSGGPEFFGLELDVDPAVYALAFFAAVDELYEQTMHGEG